MRETVQEVLPGVLIVALVHVKLLSWAEAVRLSMEALLTPAYDAMSEALCVLGIPPVVAEKLTEL